MRLLGGAALCGLLHVTNDDFTHLPHLLAACDATLLLPLFFLGFIPDKLNGGGGGDDAAAVAAAPAEQAAAAKVPPQQAEVGEEVGVAAMGGSVLWASAGGSASAEQRAALGMAELALMLQPGAAAAHRHLGALPLQPLALPAPQAALPPAASGGAAAAGGARRRPRRGARRQGRWRGQQRYAEEEGLHGNCGVVAEDGVGEWAAAAAAARVAGPNDVLVQDRAVSAAGHVAPVEMQVPA